MPGRESHPYIGARDSVLKFMAGPRDKTGVVAKTHLNVYSLVHLVGLKIIFVPMKVR